jgi:hypothetical protein
VISVDERSDIPTDFEPPGYGLRHMRALPFAAHGQLDSHSTLLIVLDAVIDESATGCQLGSICPRQSKRWH